MILLKLLHLQSSLSPEKLWKTSGFFFLQKSGNPDLPSVQCFKVSSDRELVKGREMCISEWWQNVTTGMSYQHQQLYSCCMPGYYKADRSASDCEPCAAGSCTSEEGSTECRRCQGDDVCPEGCSSPRKCRSWAEHVDVDNSHCHWSTAFYITLCIVILGTIMSCCWYRITVAVLDEVSKTIYIRRYFTKSHKGSSYTCLDFSVVCMYVTCLSVLTVSPAIIAEPIERLAWAKETRVSAMGTYWVHMSVCSANMIEWLVVIRAVAAITVTASCSCAVQPCIFILYFTFICYYILRSFYVILHVRFNNV